MALVWADAPDTSERTVDAHIKLLRAKLRERGASPDLIQTHRNLGYAMQGSSLIGLGLELAVRHSPWLQGSGFWRADGSTTLGAPVAKGVSSAERPQWSIFRIDGSAAQVPGGHGSNF